ncbi:MAG: TonB-dependent receptor domain-containing protein [Methylococcaceae bacterium]
MKQIILLSFLSIFSLISLGFTAQAEDTVKLPNVVVTATRTNQTIDHLSAASTVFTRADIERLQLQSVPELLKRATGVDVSESGGPGKNSSVFIRGTSSGHVLVLVDGVRIGSASLGTSPFSSLPIDQIERVEIVRGSQSSLYGSDAIGGVIQIFTRKGGQKEDYKPTISIDAGGGSYDTAKVSGNVSGKYKKAWYSFGASHITTAGFNATSASANDNDRDGYENTSFNARVGYQFNDQYSAEAFIIRSDGENEFDNNFGSDRNDFVIQNIGLTAKMQLTDYWLSILTFGESRDEYDQPDGDYFNTRRRMVSLSNKINLGSDHEIIIGSDFRDDQVQSHVSYAETNRYDIGGFAEYYGRWFDLIDFNASVRGDEDEQFGSHVTGNAGFRIELADSDVDFVANFSSGYKAPTFNSLYFPGFGTPNLRPEESTTFEVGLEGQHGWGNWMLRAYHINIDNLISFDRNTFRAVNVNKAQVDGIEGEISTQLFGWSIALNGSALSPKDRKTNERLTHRSQLHLGLDVSRKFFDRLTIGSALAVSGDRSYTLFGGGTAKTHGSVVWDMRAAYQLNKSWTLKGKLNNVLNDQYQTNRGFNTADRNFFASVNYTY